MSKFWRLFVLAPLAFLPTSLPSCSFQQDDGGIYKTTDMGGNWSQNTKIEEDEKNNLSSTNTLDLVADPNNPAVVFWLIEGMGLFVSNNFGDSWKRIIPETDTVYSLAPERKEKGVFYLSAKLNNRGKILKTENGGLDWREVYTESGEESVVERVASHSFTPNTVFAVNSLNLLTGSNDGGLTWQALFSFPEKVKNLVVDEEKNGQIWVLTDQNLWKSSENGLNFVKIQLGEYGSLGNNFYFLKKNRTGLFVSTEKGLFRSQDEGETWQKISVLSDPKNNPVLDLALIESGQNNGWIALAGMAMYLSFDEGRRWKPIQFEVSRRLNKILTKIDDPKQILIGVTNARISNSLGLSF